MPVIILIVEKCGEVKQLALKSYDESKLYTKAGFKSANGFVPHHTWNATVNGETYCVTLYGKTQGLANSENKYDFPPPADNMLFFGNCLLVNRTQSGEAANLTAETWKLIYEKLFGGFVDLNQSMSDSDEEDLECEHEKQLVKMNADEFTKSGYLKDDFVVDSDEDELGEEEPTQPTKRKPAKRASTATSSKKKSKKNEQMAIAVDAQEEYLGCTDELTEESYV